MVETKQLHHAGVDLLVRPGTSDFKVFKEVIVNHVYQHGFRGSKAKFEPLPNEVWLDLGGNIGAFTVWAGKRGARVVAYEPEEVCFELLEKNIALNGTNAKAVKAAVVAGDEKKMTLSLGEPGSEWRNSLYKFKSPVQQEVDCININEALTPDITGVKMDIEGAEIDILQTVDDWKNVQKLVFEWSFDVNNEMAVFWKVINKLKKHFRVVKHAKIPPDLKYYDFFPPAQIVYCLR